MKSKTCIWLVMLLALPASNLHFSTACAQSAQPIYSFTDGNDGGEPYATLTLGPNGHFYGTTFQGGTNGYGTVFEVTTNGALTSLHSFAALSFDSSSSLYTNADGVSPETALALGPDGNFYGTTEAGGTNGYGTVFEVTTNGALTTLVNFAGTNGANPEAALMLGPGGNFYGTTASGGSSNVGTVFEMTTNGTLTTLVNFAITNGRAPVAALTLGPNGNFYGTTGLGGSSTDGTMFEMTTNGTLTTLVNFTGTYGKAPLAALTLGPNGNFYGTTEQGSSSNDGTVFEMTTNGALTTLVSFAGTNGATPHAALTLGPDGNFYGTTALGGSNGSGVVYLLDLQPAIIQQPIGQSVLPGSQVTFSVTPASTLPYAFQWLFNDVPLVADTNSTLTLPDVTFTNSGGYSVIVTDAWGSVTSSVAVLTVSDTPVITLLGANPLTNYVYDYTDPGATATDPVYGNLTGSIVVSGDLNTNVPGTYTINYSVTNSIGNSAMTNRTVVILPDTNAPVITLLGPNPLTNFVNNYTDPGATATDPVYGNLTGSIVVSGNLNTSVPGTYTVTYSVTDPAGNSAMINRTVVLFPLPTLGVVSAFGNQAAIFWPPGSDTNYVLQMTTNLAGGDWVNVTNSTPLTGVFVTNSSPAAFFRLQPQ